MEEEKRPDPEKLLKQIKRQEQQIIKKQKGKLKIFLGYAAGSGKTYTMLEAAHEAKKHGIDVVAGYIEPHARPDTQAMAEGIEEIQVKMVEYKGVKLREFDLDAALKRKPKLLLVDELAHTNAKGCRHEKRYQDVEELLRAGINVYTTMNIQHLESLNDLVGSITKIQVKERVPDSVFDHADQVEVIDIEPEDLIDRMKEGKIYNKIQAERALQNFFRKDKLIALREIALRRTADRVNRIASEEREAMGSDDYHTGEHILTCISPSPSSAKVIRTASRLAYAFHGEFTGLCVETPSIQASDEKVKKGLQNNIELAKALGARIVTVFGEDVAYQIAEYAKVGNVSRIVIGRTAHKVYFGQTRSSLLERLNQYAPNVDVYIIPDLERSKGGKKYEKRVENHWKKEIPTANAAKDLLKITGVLALATLAAFLFQKMQMPEANIIMTYILGVLVAAYLADRKIYTLYSSVVSVLAFNFFFTEPYFSLDAYDRGYPITFVMMFVVAFFASSLTNRLRRQNVVNAKKAYRTEILLENSQKLRRCKSKNEVWDQVAGQVMKLLDLSIMLYPVTENGYLGPVKLYPRKGMSQEQLQTYLNSKEEAVAAWVLANGHRAGSCTHTLPDADGIYLPIRSEDQVEGVMGLLLEEHRPINHFEYGLLIAMLNETAVKLQDVFLEE